MQTVSAVGLQYREEMRKLFKLSKMVLCKYLHEGNRSLLICLISLKVCSVQ